jgi:hypothetical protein
VTELGSSNKNDGALFMGKRGGAYVADSQQIQLVTTWLGTITALAVAAKALLEFGVARAKKKTNDTASEAVQLTPEEHDFADNLVIDPHLLKDLVADIEKANREFRDVLEDPTSTTDQMNEAQSRAAKAICKHLAKIRELNNGRLPGHKLQNEWQSFQCSHNLESEPTK